MIDFPTFSAGDPTVKREAPVSFPEGPIFDVVGADEEEAISPGAIDPAVEVSRTLSPTDEPRAFVAPTLQEIDRFEFHTYATAGFRDIAEMQLIAGGGDLLSTEEEVLARQAEFEEIADTVFRDITSGSEMSGVDDGTALAVLVSDASFERLNDNGSGAGTPTGIVCQPQDSGGSQPDVPQVALRPEYESDDGVVTVTHESGDSVGRRTSRSPLEGEPTTLSSRAASRPRTGSPSTRAATAQGTSCGWSCRARTTTPRQYWRSTCFPNEAGTQCRRSGRRSRRAW